MVTYELKTWRIVRRFVLRKRIGDEVRFFQVCCWKEEYQAYTTGEGWEKKFLPVCFVPEYEFRQLNARTA